MTANNDSNDLEALFDSIASDYKTEPVQETAPKAAPPVDSGAGKSAGGGATQLGDSDDLQALFDSVSLQTQAVSVPSQVAEPAVAALSGEQAEDAQERVFNSIGHMARILHDTLKELGYDKLLEQTMSALPDAKDRLAYVANLTEQAACRVLNATDIANPIVEDVEQSSKALGDRWEKVFANQVGQAEFRQLALDTRAFLQDQLPSKARATHAQLTEIMMAQDFQDLTGQVIKKIVALAQTLESGLMGVLIEVMPDTKRTEEVTNLMNGPVINAEGRTDVVVNQQQVDDLLDSLGF